MALKTIRGRVAFIFTEVDFDVDQMIGVKNIKLQNVEELAAVAMQAYDPNFRSKVKPGDILVGAENFGYGHPHYPPLRAMRHMGISAIVAESFSPGYWRGELSNGFPQAACKGILRAVERWDEVEIDFEGGEVRNLTRGVRLPIEPLTQLEREMIEAGGLVPYLKRSQARGSDQAAGRKE
jgi:3-isopropylmalate/(R)-2-methylmalate dehydratase small subunit